MLQVYDNGEKKSDFQKEHVKKNPPLQSSSEPIYNGK